MLENEETKRDIPERKRRDSPNVFSHALQEVVSDCQYLITAIDNHDFEDVEHTARHSTSMWLAAHAAHQRIVHCGQSTTSLEGPRSLLEARTTLLDLFTRAKAEIAVPRMHRLLDELRETLVSAGDESIADGTPSQLARGSQE